MQHPMTRTGRTAPEQDALIESIRRHVVTEPGPDVPGDGYDRVDYRLEIILESLYDGVHEEVGDAPVRDLLTDVVHLCEARGWNLYEMLAAAQFMAAQERSDWGDR